jgi:acyl-CoA synthetase (AMP-forming)/AMP-acid ligase II
MVVLPFFYVFGKSLLNSHFAVGGSVVINNKFAFPAVVLKQMAEENVTGLSGVPSTYAYLLHRSPLEKYRNKLPHLRYCSQAGGHMAQTLKVKLRKILPKHTQIFAMYGATEASARMSCLLPHQFKNKIESIGKTISGVNLSAVDKNGKQLPKSEIGELVASGENIMLGYWNDPQSTAKVVDANGYHTGDIGYQDDDGFFYVTGRKDNLIKVNGHRINPQEIEDVLQSTGLTIESAVFATKDDLGGNKLFALVTPKDSKFSAMSLMCKLEKKLPRYKMPSGVIPIRAIPKKANGKIDRTKCLELLAN